MWNEFQFKPNLFMFCVCYVYNIAAHIRTLNKYLKYIIVFKFVLFSVGHCELFMYCFVFSCSLGGLDWFWIKVAFSIHRGLFLSVRGITGIHIVRRNSSCYSTEARHGDLEELCIIFLEFGWHWKSHINNAKWL